MKSSLSRKRAGKMMATISLVAVVYFIHRQLQQSLHAPEYFTGWVMLVTLLFLVLLNVRKKLGFLPLGSAYRWTQLHVYGGIFLLLVSFFHIGYPDIGGGYETGLMSIFLLASVSGLYGIYISRRFPVTMSRHQEYVIYERMPGIRATIRENVESLVDRSVDEMQSVAIADFYRRYLHGYLSSAADFWTHLSGRTRVHAKWKARFKALRLYLDEEESALLDEIEALTLCKVDLDAQNACRRMLKYWLFLHIPVAYVALLLAVVHVFLVYSFGWSGI